jgi:hypothetical protein
MNLFPFSDKQVGVASTGLDTLEIDIFTLGFLEHCAFKEIQKPCNPRWELF